MRHYSDWLTAYIDYAGHGEAPVHCMFWTGVSTIAGALRRRVWIDQAYFKWHSNMYIILVAPPGIVSKSSTVAVGMNLLRQVPQARFGPDIVTWQGLVQAFSEAQEDFAINDISYVSSPLTLESSEFGNLVDPRDRKLVDLLVNLWDGKQGVLSKVTKSAGNNEVENPWINLIACTTPSWIAGNIPEYMLGGGFTSRCIFVYADKKAKLVAYPIEHVPEDQAETERKLVEDLQDIANNLVGPYQLTESAKVWGREWYQKHYSERSSNLVDDDRFGGYVSRKQTHIHKLAMILAASASNELLITESHLSVAESMVTDLEPDMARVFNRVGKGSTSFYADRLIQYIHRSGPIPYTEAYRFIHDQFPMSRDFEDVFAGLVNAGFVKLSHLNGVAMVEAIINKEGGS